MVYYVSVLMLRIIFMSCTFQHDVAISVFSNRVSVSRMQGGGNRGLGSFEGGSLRVLVVHHEDAQAHDWNEAAYVCVCCVC